MQNRNQDGRKSLHGIPFPLIAFDNSTVEQFDAQMVLELILNRYDVELQCTTTNALIPRDEYERSGGLYHRYPIWKDDRI